MEGGREREGEVEGESERNAVDVLDKAIEYCRSSMVSGGGEEGREGGREGGRGRGREGWRERGRERGREIQQAFLHTASDQ